MLIREAFLRGISTRQVGRIVALITGGPISAQTVSRLTRELDGAVRKFHAARLKDEWSYLFVDECGGRPGATACKCWSLTGFAPTVADNCWLSAQQRREPICLGRVVAQSL